MTSTAERRELVDRVVSVSAAVVAMSALAVSAYQAKLARDQQRASVWPRVALMNTTGPHIYARLIQNVGLGPALVRSMQVTLDGRPVRSWDEMAHRLLGPDAERIVARDSLREFIMNTVHRGSVVLPGAVVEQLRLKGGILPDTVRKAAYSGRLLWTTCYCSLYGDCWTATSRGDIDPKTVRTCPEQADSTREFRD